MGLFSSSYETRVGTVVSRVCEDKLLPNSIRSGGLRAVVKDMNIPETVLDELSSSIALKAERMYVYGEQHYTHGLPSGQFVSAIQGREQVTAVLETLHGGAVELAYSHYQPPNMQHIGWLKLIQEHGYNPTTNQLAQLSTSIGKTVYLEDMVLVIPESLFANYSLAALEQWGTPATSGYSPNRKNAAGLGIFRGHTLVSRDDLATVPHIRVTYSWEVPTVVGAGMEATTVIVIHTGSFTLSVAGYDDKVDYFQVKYRYGGVDRYWMYRAGTGTYPTLDGVFIKPAEVNGSFFPFAYFRYNKVSEVADKTTAAYKTSKKLVKYLGMNYDQVANGIDENPDIADVEQAMVIMAVPANSSNALEQRYLFEFFDNLYDSNANKYSSPASLGIAMSQANGSDLARSTLVIQDKRFKMALTNGGLTKKRVVGSIGKVGTHSFLLDEIELRRTYFNEITSFPTEQVSFIKVHVYRKQVSHHIYEEIRVVSLQMLYYVFENYIATGDENDAILLIPLDRSITEAYSLPDREVLFSRSLHYVFNSRVVTEVKWYQSSFFKFLMTAVAVFITITSMGTGASALSLAISAGNGAAISAALTVLLTNFLIGTAIGLLLKAVAKAIGVEAALIIAVIAAAATGYMEFSGIDGAPWVDQLLKLATGLAKASSDVLADMFKELAQEFDALAALAEETNKELTEANKLLENNNYLSPIVIFGETPNDFYNRTIHSGNIGITAISAISSYVDIALTLPKLSETLGESPYEPPI